MTETQPAITVMVVEDDKLLSDLLARKFTAEHFNLIHAPTGELALELLKTTKPDLVLLDILLPGIDGFEVLRNIKANPDTKNIPVVILSNLGQESDIKRGQELGAEKFIVKVTLTLDEVVAMVRGVSESAHKAAA